MSVETLYSSESLSRARAGFLFFRPAHLKWITLLLAIIALFALVLAWGSASIPLEQVLKILFTGEADKASWVSIVTKVRLPKALTALLAGAALAVSGLVMQTFFRNPLAGPYILGISSGASLGVGLVVLAGGTASGLVVGIGLGGDFLLAAAASVGAAAALGIVLIAARRVENSLTLLVLGVMFGSFTSAIVSLLMYFSAPERVQSYIQWTFGSFSTVTISQLAPLAIGVIAGLIVTGALAKSLNALLLGEDYARTMGLSVGRVRLLIVTGTALLAGTVTAFCGPVGFIGTAVPHLCRALFKTSDHRILLPACGLMGAGIGLAAALIAEMPGSDLILPLNAITALMGAPVVMFVLMRQRQLHKAFGG
jgi:iron complex transport system permease protein